MLKRLRILCPILALLMACSDPQVAGGYDDVENPALTLSFSDIGGKSVGLTEVKVYARFQNPTVDTLPILIRTANANGSVTLNDTVLVEAMRLARIRGINWPSADSIPFNVVGSTANSEAFSANILLSRGKNQIFRFSHQVDGSSQHLADIHGKLNVAVTLKNPVQNLKGNIGIHGMELGLQSLFIAGSPYWAKIGADGSFTLAKIAANRFELKAISTTGKVYSSPDTLNSESPDSTFRSSNWTEADLIWIEK